MTLEPDQLFTLEGRVFVCKDIVPMDAYGLVVIAECLEQTPRETTNMWSFPVGDKRGLKHFERYTRCVFH